MNRPSLDADEDQDSLFGSPPPSPVRGRSPSQEAFVPREEVGDATPGAGAKNVGTIALPGSHMSCAELPANLPAASLSSHASSGTTPPSTTGTPILAHTPAGASRSSTHSAPSRASSAASAIRSSSSTGKRRTRKAKPVISAPPTPPITLPGPNESTPPNFLRSQSSLLGLAGLVGSVKPARLHAHNPQPSLIQQPHPCSPTRGSTPAHPIVLDDDQDALHTGKRPCGQHQVPQHPHPLNPETLRSNMINTLVKEKNISPVLESLIKLLGDEPRHSSAHPSPQSFARPYGHGIFNAQSPALVAPPYTFGGSTNPSAPPPKRRKLKHVPAGAADWDVPFPFAAGEGPEAYRDTWARDRVKQLVTQLLELVQSAIKRAAIKTAKNGTEGRTRAQSYQSSRSTSVETQSRGISSMQSNHTSASPEIAMPGTPSNATLDSLGHYLASLETGGTSGCEDRMSMNSHGMVEEAGSAATFDNSAFEEWLSQLQQFVPPETDASTPEPNRGTRPSAPSDSSASGPAQSIHVPMQRDASVPSHTTRDEVIDPTLLAISQQAGSTYQSHSPTSPTSILVPGYVSRVPDIPSTPPPALAHSPRTSLSSLTEPLTPLSEVFPDVPAISVHQDLGREPSTRRSVEKDPPTSQIQVQESSPKDPPELPRITAAQKGKARADVSAASVVPSVPSRSTTSTVSTSNGTLDKRAILECARERRRQLVAEIERAKMESWAASIENAVLVHFTRNGSS